MIKGQHPAQYGYRLLTPYRLRLTVLTINRSQNMPRYREALISDLPSICVLGNEVNAFHHDNLPDIFAAEGEPERDRAHWLQSIERENATTFVAEASGTLVGFVTVGIVDESLSLLIPLRYGRIGTIGVAADFRDQGIGRSLMALAEDWAHARGVVDIRLNIWAFNDRAMRLYKSLGYEIRSNFLGKRIARPETTPQQGANRKISEP